MKRGILLICAAFFFAAHHAPAEPLPGPGHDLVTVNHAFRAGERLAYRVSWSGFLTAGKAVMEVRAEKTPDGRDAFRLVSIARSAGLVTTFYPVADTVQSVVDAEKLCSLFYSLDQKHGKRKKQRQMFLDQEKRIVRIVSDGVTETHEIPFHAQDALSALYYLRTRQDLKPGSSLIINVHDAGKNWAVEVRILGREKLETSLGTFDTIKVVTYPKYEGVFLHKGEIMIWLTDDARKVPLLMKSKIAIGSIMATLTEMKDGGEKQ